jgi:SPP1 gp7 family putative phage head morphogenesis protein
MSSRLDDVLREYRDALRGIESSATADLLAVLAVLSQDLRLQQATFLERIGSDWSTLPVALRIARIDALAEHAQSFGTRLSSQLDRSMRTTASGVIEASTEYAPALTAARLGSASVNWNRVPIEQVQEMLGVFSAGSPVRSLLDEFGRDASSAVRQTMLKSVALGANPRVIARQIERSIVENSPEGRIADELLGVTGNLRDRALTISMTETHRAARAAALVNYEANADAVEGWQWSSARDMRTCPLCWAMDGRIFKHGKPMPAHVRCRCVALPWLGEIDDYGTGEAAFARRDEEEQRASLGPARFELYRKGLQLSEMVTVRSSRTWGDSVRHRTLKEIDEGRAKARLPGRKPRSVEPGLPAWIANTASPNEMDELTRDLYGKRRHLVNRAEDADNAIKRVFGRNLSDAELGRLVGALDDSRLLVTEEDGNCVISIQHDLIKSQRRIYRRDMDGIYCHNDIFVLEKRAKKGTGTRMFAMQVRGAIEFGVKGFDTHAAGNRDSPHYNGYYTWPRMGYTSPIPSRVMGLLRASELEDQLRKATRVEQLMGKKVSRDWWRYNGEGLVQAEFDLRPHSYSLHALTLVLLASKINL